MGYLSDLVNRLRPKLAPLPESVQDEVVRLIADEVLKSYKNGLAEGRRGGKRESRAK